MKEKYTIWALLGIGAIILIIYLMRQNSNSEVAAVSAPASASAPPYPNSNPIQLGDISIGGSPTNLTYNNNPGNQLVPTTAVQPPSDDNCCCGSSSSVSSLVSVNTIPQNIISNGIDNLKGYYNKISSGAIPALSSAPLEAYNY